MTRCLSDDALERVEAELASVAERAHLAGCAACAARHRQIRGELALITGVLRDTPEPGTRPAPARRMRWMPATVGLAAVAAALLIWVEVAVWRAVTPVPPTMQAQEVAAILADVSAALFSVSGDPPATTTPAAIAPAVIAEDAPLSLEVMARELDQALTGGAP
ncbi:MAG TPA: hypothetical protein VNF52_10695 [Candidatus Dormibacteraeota bacterium]|jgi:hypothetical protein|nr:hypothetical protein [Candidatus Dormibacteraeota bacterium]